jgi:hypothetical protein
VKLKKGEVEINSEDFGVRINKMDFVKVMALDGTYPK